MTTETVEQTPAPEEEAKPVEQATDTAVEEPTSEESPPSEEERPKKTGVQKRIDELVREREEAKRERDALKQRLEAANTGGGAPQLDDYDNYEDYLVARATFNMEQKQQQQRAEQDEQYRQALAIENAQLFAQRQEEAKKVYSDYEKVANNPNLPITPQMAQIITAQENGPDIAYYLGKNPQEAASLAQMDPMSAAIRIGQISAKVTTPTPKPTSAPDPVEPLNGGQETPDVDPDKMPMEDWMRWRRNQLK